MSEVKSREIEKNRIRDILVRIAACQDELLYLDAKSNFYVTGVTRNEIHLYDKNFLEVADKLGAVITFNPNWCERYPNTLEAYFYMELNGKKYKLFSLMKKGATVCE